MMGLICWYLYVGGIWQGVCVQGSCGWFVCHQHVIVSGVLLCVTLLDCLFCSYCLPCMCLCVYVCPVHACVCVCLSPAAGAVGRLCCGRCHRCTLVLPCRSPLQAAMCLSSPAWHDPCSCLHHASRWVCVVGGRWRGVEVLCSWLWACRGGDLWASLEHFIWTAAAAHTHGGGFSRACGARLD